MVVVIHVPWLAGQDHAAGWLDALTERVPRARLADHGWFGFGPCGAVVGAIAAGGGATPVTLTGCAAGAARPVSPGDEGRTARGGADLAASAHPVPFAAHDPTPIMNATASTRSTPTHPTRHPLGMFGVLGSDASGAGSVMRGCSQPGPCRVGGFPGPRHDEAPTVRAGARDTSGDVITIQPPDPRMPRVCFRWSQPSGRPSWPQRVSPRPRGLPRCGPCRRARRGWPFARSGRPMPAR